MFSTDLDGFKSINDTLGHHAGDELLVQVAARMKHTIRQEEMISRIGGDEFIVVLTSPAEEMAKRGRLVGERIISTINKPYSLNGQHASISCSIGGAFWVSSNSKKIEETIKLADEALYTAKKKGKNQVHFAKD